MWTETKSDHIYANVHKSIIRGLNEHEVPLKLSPINILCYRCFPIRIRIDRENVMWLPKNVWVIAAQLHGVWMKCWPSLVKKWYSPNSWQTGLYTIVYLSWYSESKWSSSCRRCVCFCLLLCCRQHWWQKFVRKCNLVRWLNSMESISEGTRESTSLTRKRVNACRSKHMSTCRTYRLPMTTHFVGPVCSNINRK